MEHGKFQLALAQALMDRPLPEDFGMPLSQSGWNSLWTPTQAEQSIGTDERRNSVSDSQGVRAAIGEDVILSQKSINAEMGGAEGGGEGTEVLDVPLVANVDSHGVT
jgi:hypothetical protein